MAVRSNSKRRLLLPRSAVSAFRFRPCSLTCSVSQIPVRCFLTYALATHPSIRPPCAQLSRALKRADEWQFNSFELEVASGGCPLSCMAFFLMKKMELVSRFHLNETRLAR